MCLSSTTVIFSEISEGDVVLLYGEGAQHSVGVLIPALESLIDEGWIPRGVLIPALIPVW